MTFKTSLIFIAAVATFFGYRPVKTEPTPTATPAPSPVPTIALIPTITPRPTRVPTPTIKPQPQFTSQQIYEFTNQFGGQYGVDPNVLRHIALCESTFKPNAKNYIYAGLFQFDARTWRVYRQKMGENPDPDLRFNAPAAVQTAAFTLSRGGLHLWPNCLP